MGITVGIDLGTTYSAVATFDKASGTTRILKNSFNSDTTPSVVYIEGRSTLIGSEAKDLQSAGNENTASFYKSWMGNPNFSAYLDGKTYSSEDLSGIFLRELVKDIESNNNVKIDGAVITVPAYFNDAQRDATLRAGKKAGLNVLKIINEPTAAIISYGLTDSGDKNVMVYDLGGGTFDVTVAKVSGAVVTVLGTDGDHQLGGKDWDLCIKNYLAECFENEYGISIFDHPDADNELQVEAETIKKKLTQLPKVMATVSCEGYVGKYEITREWFDEETKSVLGKTQFLVSQCLRDIGFEVNGEAIDEVVLVGGSTRMPQVKDMILNEYGKQPVTSVDVDTVVARGAAIQAAICTEKRITMSLGGPSSGARPGTAAASNTGRRTLQLSADNINDVTAHSLGMLSVSEDKSRYVNTIIIPKNSHVPSVLQRPFKIASRRGGDGEIEVYILQGEGIVPSDNYTLGKYLITGIDPQDEKETVVDIAYAYNDNGMVDVSAVQRKTGKQLKVTKMPVPDDMSWIDEPPVIKDEKVSSTIYLVIDTSGSMYGSMNKVENAAMGFLNDLDITSSKIGVVAFNSTTKMISQPTNAYKDIVSAIKKVTANANGGTNEPLSFMLNNFGALDQKNYIIVLTDGEWSGESSAIASSQKLKSKGIEIVAVGIADANEAFLKKIASSSEAALKTDVNSMTGSFSSIAQAITEGKGNISLGK